MTCLVRRIAAWLAVAALAFSQLAVAAYACPASMPESGPDIVQDMADECGKLPSPNLCERHCDYGASSVQTASPPAIVPEPALLPWRVEPFVALSASASSRERLLPARADPPPLVLFGVLRI
jgi:hypothetical protein